MKNLFSVTAVTVVLIIIFLLSLSSKNYIHADTQKSRQIIIENTTKELATQELANMRASLSFKGVDPQIFSNDEINSLATGKIIKKINYLFFIPVGLFPILVSDVFNINTYTNNNSLVLKTSQIKIARAENALDIAIISFYLPLVIIFFIPLAHYKSYSSRKLKLLICSFLANLFIFFSFISGLLLSSIVANVPISSIIVIILLAIVIMLVGITKIEKTLIISGIIASFSIGIFTSRLSILGYGLFSSQLALIWEYIGLYIVATIIGQIIMWHKESAEEPIYINL